MQKRTPRGDSLLKQRHAITESCRSAPCEVTAQRVPFPDIEHSEPVFYRPACLLSFLAATSGTFPHNGCGAIGLTLDLTLDITWNIT